MMSDEQLEDFISQMHDFLEDKQEECGEIGRAHV